MTSPQAPAELNPSPQKRRGFWIVAVALLGVFFLGGAGNVADLDMWHGMCLIREALHTGSIPTEDSFAYTPTVSPVLHHEWAAAAVVYFVATRAGAGGILALKYLLVAAIAATAVLTGRKRGAGGPVIFVLAPLAVCMSWIGTTTIRAQLFTLFFLAVLLS